MSRTLLARLRRLEQKNKDKSTIDYAGAKDRLMKRLARGGPQSLAPASPEEVVQIKQALIEKAKQLSQMY